MTGRGQGAPSGVPASLPGVAACVGLALLLGGPGGTARATVPPHAAPFPAVPHAHLHALLEKTLFRVDVLNLDIQVDAATADRLAGLVAGNRNRYSDPLADGVARTVLLAPQAWVRMEFLRNTSRDQFLGGIRDNMEKALAAKLIDRDYFDRTQEQLPGWYDFLSGRGVHKGDIMAYWVRADTLESTYRDADGEVLLDMTRTGPEQRYGVLGSYLAPGSSFRENLVRSLLE